MPSLIINNTVQMRLIWSNTGVPFAVNVMHGIKNLGITVVTQEGVQALADDLKARFLASDLKNQLGSQITLSQVGLRDLNSANEPEYAATITGAAGVGASEILPLNVSACATLRTAKAGASYRGRYYQAGYIEGSSVGGMMGANVGPYLVNWLEDVREAMDTAGLQLSVASRKLGISNAVTGITVRDQRWDTQRRRSIPGI